MDRIPVDRRPDLAAAAAAHGFEFIDGVGIPFWDETAYYRFTERQIEDDIEATALEIEQMCFEVVKRAVGDEDVMRRLAIPEPYWDFVAASWRDQNRNLLGRMDFAYDGTGPAKLYEYNADTPTALYESAVFQWEWLERAIELGLVPDESDQFNDIHEAIVEAFSRLGIEGPAHFASNADVEDDRGTLEYLADCAGEAGIPATILSMPDIGVDAGGAFTDLDDNVITTLVKLYPWEWIMAEEFGRYLPDCGVTFIEPPWKAILSNKGLLPFLWEMFECHPGLLPAFFEDDPRAAALGGTYVRKPVWSRQGANVEIVGPGAEATRRDGPYGAEGHVVQAYRPLPEIDGNYPLLGCWIVASQAVGLGIREDRTLVTGPDCRFVPHVVLG